MSCRRARDRRCVTRFATFRSDSLRLGVAGALQSVKAGRGVQHDHQPISSASLGVADGLALVIEVVRLGDHQPRGDFFDRPCRRQGDWPGPRPSARIGRWRAPRCRRAGRPPAATSTAAASARFVLPLAGGPPRDDPALGTPPNRSSTGRQPVGIGSLTDEGFARARI